MKKWEYCVISVRPYEYIEKLNEMGELGWELCDSLFNIPTNTWQLVLKRLK